MSEILLHYHRVNPTTWVYLSSLLTIGLYFKFGRFWSVRNLDLVLLILLAPGLLMAQYGREARVRAERLVTLEAAAFGGAPQGSMAEEGGESAGELRLRAEPLLGESTSVPPQSEPEGANPGTVGAESGQPLERPGEGEDVAGSEPSGGDRGPAPSTAAMSLVEKSQDIERWGFVWLFAVGGLLLIRLLLDPTMVRRPLLEANLSTGGLAFIGCSLAVFLMANVITRDPARLDVTDIQTIEQIAPGEPEVEDSSPAVRHGPGYALLNLIPSIPTAPLVPEGVRPTQAERTYIWMAKAIVISCHLAVILGMVLIGYWHFGNTKTGIGAATLYLMLPYTAQMTGHIDHVIPAALFVWAILCYRRPLTAGMFIGLATSLVYYPLFLLPLWISFYWRRGLMRFAVGVVLTLVAMAVSLAFIPEASYWENLKQMFGLWLPVQEGLEGFWGLVLDPAYRLPVLAAFFALSGTLALWPAQKNLGTLLSCSAAVMVATQFWHGYGGGLYMAWYLPLALLTVFRPNLEDRVALAVLGAGWMSRRAARAPGGFKAA